MIKTTSLFLISLLIFIIFGCGKNKEQKRIEELRSLPELWKSTILVANPSIPDMKVLIPMYDSYDANLLEHMTATAEKTEDYIPQEVRAYAVDEYNNKPTDITIEIDDEVSVLQETKNNSNKLVYLIRTEYDTYAWLYLYHIQDEDGERISRL